MPPNRTIVVYDSGTLEQVFQYKRFYDTQSPPSDETMTIRRFNEYYSFYSATHVVSELSDRIKDPSYLVIAVPIQILVEIHRYLAGPALKKIARYHWVPTFNVSVTSLKEVLRIHVCSSKCQSYFLVFKASSRPRPNIEAKFIITQVPLVVARHSPLIRYERAECRFPDHMSDNSASESYGYFAHLNVPNEERLEAIIRQWQKEFSIASLTRGTCAVCGSRVAQSSLSTVDPTQLDLTLLRNPKLPVHVLPRSYNLAAYHYAILHPNGLLNREFLGPIRVCSSCLSDLTRGKMPKYAQANFLYYGREALPPEIRRAFEESTPFDKAMICRARGNVLCCRFDLPGHDNSGDIEGTYRKTAKGMKGNVIIAPLDVIELNAVLPPPPEIIRDSLCVIFTGFDQIPTRDTLESYHPVLVRKSRVKILLEFLLNWNPHYRRVDGFRGYDSETLNGLFGGTSDQGFPHAVEISYLDSNQVMENANSGYVADKEVVPEGEGLSSLLMENVGYTMSDNTPAAYEEMKRRAVDRCLANKAYINIRKGRRLVPDFDNPYLMSWMFPHLDPWGIGGFHHPGRTRPISMQEQLKHLLSLDDNAFEDDIQFSLVFYNIIRKKLVSTSLQFSAPIHRYRKIVDDILSVDKTTLMQLSEKYRNEPMYQPSNDRENHIVRTLKSIGLIARAVPGSAAHKISMRNEIRAIINSRGAPTLFVTLNPSDKHNHLVQVFSRTEFNTEELLNGTSLTAWQRRLFAAKNPGACALFFDAMIKGFIRIVLRYGEPEGLYGRCDAYYGTVEAQGRGTLHCHMLIWLHGHPSPSELQQSLENSEEHRSRLVSWLEFVMQGDYQGSDGADTARHAWSQRLQRELCGGSGPHPGSTAGPMIDSYPSAVFWNEYRHYLNYLLVEYNIHEHTSTCWKYLARGEPRTDANCRLGMNGEVQRETEFDLETGAILVKKTHPKMTHYTGLVMFLLKCNIDVRFIGSGSGANSFMYYVTDYITKPAMTMHVGLTALSYAIKRAECKIQELQEAQSLSPSDAKARVTFPAMISAVNSMMGRQEISLPQIMSYLVGGGDNYTSERFASYNYGETLRFIQRSESPDDESGSPHVMDTQVTLSLSDDGISASNKRLDYMYRPTEHVFETMCLYDFVSLARKETMKGKEQETVEQPVPPVAGTSHKEDRKLMRFSSDEHPQYESHGIYCRLYGVTPVLLGPNLARRGDGTGESWARDMLILFKPWRTIDDLKAPGSTWMQSFDHFKENLTERHVKIIKNMGVLSQSKEDRNTHARNRASRQRVELIDSADLDDDTLEIPSSLNHCVYGSSGTRENLPETFEHPEIRLKDIIGSKVLKEFERCYPTDLVVGVDKYESAFVTMTDPETHSIVEKQTRMLLEYKTNEWCVLPRPYENDDARIQRTRLEYAPLFRPSARVTTLERNHIPLPLRETLQNSTDARWNEVARIIKERNLERNQEQLRAFMIIANHIIQGGNQLLMFINGMGGTGKSYLIKTIVELFEAYGRRSELLIGAPTGIAAVLIGGNTLHSLLMTGITKRKVANERLSEKWLGISYLIIDEISMVGASFLATVSSRIKLAKGDDVLNSGRPYGGVNVIFLGDFCQLKPPQQLPLYSHILVHSPSYAQTRDNSALDALGGAYLWRQVNTVVILRENQRQKTDPVFGKVLENIRMKTWRSPVDSVVWTDEMYVTYLRQRQIENVSADELATFTDAPVIVGHKVLRDALNSKLIRYHAQRLGQDVDIYYSRDCLGTAPVPKSFTRVLWDLPTTKTSEAIGRLPLFVGMRVMITENIVLGSGIVNGAEGHVTGIRYHVNGEGYRIADIVYVKVEGCSLQIPGLAIGVVPLGPVGTSIPFTFGNYHAGIKAKTFRRHQIPIVPAYSYTDYKSQGRSLERCIVDLVTARGQGVYVMLSRVKSLKGLLILRWFPPTQVFQRLPEELREELSRLEALDDITRKIWSFEDRNPEVDPV